MARPFEEIQYRQPSLKQEEPIHDTPILGIDTCKNDRSDVGMFEKGVADGQREGRQISIF